MSRLTHIFHNDAHDARFTMRVVGDGDRYGRGMSLTHTGPDPLVEFYDRRWDHDRDPDGLMLGQFISRYRLSTLLEPVRDGATVFETGITLDGGTAWRVGPEGMADCLRALMDADLVPDRQAEREARIEALTEKTTPIAWAKRLGGPGVYFAGPRCGAASSVANRPSGLSVGPVNTRATNP